MLLYLLVTTLASLGQRSLSVLIIDAFSALRMLPGTEQEFKKQFMNKIDSKCLGPFT